MAAHNRRLKTITFTLGGTAFECQVSTWNLTNNSDDGEQMFTFCPDGEFREETDDSYSLELTFFSDWRSAGISSYLWENDRADVAFVLNHHPGVVGEHVRWSGTCRIKAPNVGGDVRTTETTEATMQVVGKPTFARI